MARKVEIDELTEEAKSQDPNVEEKTPKFILKSGGVFETEDENETGNYDAVVEKSYLNVDCVFQCEMPETKSFWKWSEEVS